MAMTEQEMVSLYAAKWQTDKASEDAEAWMAAMLPWHFRGDPLAEEVVALLRQNGCSLAQPLQTMRRYAQQGNAACQALLTDMETVPAWVNFELMRTGGAMAQRHFPLLILTLTYGCLPLTFAHPDAAAIFAGTGRMEANISRRLNESASLFFGVCDSDALAPGGSMWEACLHVRLVHAIVRMKMLADGWPVATRGMPISQLATAAGPAFFGGYLLNGMRRLGAKMTDVEADGHCMIWRYTTRLLGVPDALLGETQQEQDVFDAYMMGQFFAPDATSRSIMAALLEGLCKLPPTSRIPRNVQVALVRRVLGQEMADAYGVPTGDMGRWSLGRLVRCFAAYSRLLRLPGLASVTRRLGQKVLDQLGTEGLVKLGDAGGH